jgi:hypothetical protein
MIDPKLALELTCHIISIAVGNPTGAATIGAETEFVIRCELAQRARKAAESDVIVDRDWLWRLRRDLIEGFAYTNIISGNFSSLLGSKQENGNINDLILSNELTQ